MLKNLRLKTRLLLSFFLVTCIASLATTVFSVQYFSGKIEGEAMETLRKHMQVAELVFRNHIEAVRSEGETLARDSTLKLLLNLAVKPKLEVYLEKLIASGQLHELTLVDTANGVLARQDRPELAGQETASPTQMHNELIARALREGRAVAGVERLEVASGPVLVISAAIPVEQARQLRGGDESAGGAGFSGVLLVRQRLTGDRKLGQDIAELLGVDATLYHDGAVTSTRAALPSIPQGIYEDILSGRASRVEQVDIWRNHRLSHYHPITDLFGKPLGVLEISIDAAPFTQTIQGAVATLFLVMAACILVAFSLGYVLSRSILVPVEQLMRGVNRVTSGDLGYEIKLELNDELGHLAKSFNDMAKELHGLFDTLESRILKATKDLQDTLGYLDAIIDNMADGLVVSDPHGKITRYNPAFARMLPNVPELRRFSYGELIDGQLPKPPDAEERALAPAREAEIRLPGNRIAKAVATSIFQPNPKGEFPEYLGSVTLLRDITREKEMDAMLKSTVDTLTLVGTSLSAETNIARLLELFVEEACRVCNADGGTLYTVKDGRLHFEIIRNQSMGICMGGASETPVAINPLPLDESSIAGFVATRQQVVYVPNLAENTEFDFSNVRRYDASTGYRTRAMLVVPMIGRNNDTIGVLQLINPLSPDNREIIPLTKNQTDIVNSFASQAAVALENVRSHEKIERKNIAFQRFVPTEFLRFLGKTEAEEIKLGDASQQFMSVLFSDIRAFTDRSETLSAEQNFLFLNEYLEAIGPGIVNNHGFIDKYIGDAIMALFPGSLKGVADDAVAASIDMLTQLDRFNRRLAMQGLAPVQIGVGIHTGGLTLGTIGFEGRMETTVIGDTVNLTSRMEGLTKHYGINIAISEATYEQIKEPGRFLLREIDTVLVKGKLKPTRIYEVCDCDPPPLREYKQHSAERFAEARGHYLAGDWRQAIACFEELARQQPEDRVLEVYLKRCRGYLAFPPEPGEWTGVTRLIEK